MYPVAVIRVVAEAPCVEQGHVINVIAIDVVVLDHEGFAAELGDVTPEVGQLKWRPVVLDLSNRFRKNAGQLVRQSDDIDRLRGVVVPASLKHHLSCLMRKLNNSRGIVSPSRSFFAIRFTS